MIETNDKNKDNKRITEITLFDIIKGILFVVLLFVLFFASEVVLAIVVIIISIFKKYPIIFFSLFIIIMIAALVASPAGSIAKAGFPLHTLFKSKKKKDSDRKGN